MSFPRHEGIFRSDGRGPCGSGARSERLHAPTHRLDEFPTGYSLAGCAPAALASASPVEEKFTMKAAPQPSLFQRMGKPCLAGCLIVGVHRTLPHQVRNLRRGRRCCPYRLPLCISIPYPSFHEDFRFGSSDGTQSTLRPGATPPFLQSGPSRPHGAKRRHRETPAATEIAARMAGHGSIRTILAFVDLVSDSGRARSAAAEYRHHLRRRSGVRRSGLLRTPDHLDTAS